VTSFLEVQDLSVVFPTDDGDVVAANKVSYSVDLGQTLAIVGESGSGKSVSNLAVMGLHPINRTHITGSAILNLDSGPVDVVSASQEKVRGLRGKEMSMIFQDPMSALHPFFSIGSQIAEAWQLHNEGSKEEALAKATEMLDLVGIPDPSRRVHDFPHQFSGGMRQRAMIAMALVNQPSLLIADEPTTALDVTVQSQILKLLKDLQREIKMAIILITHDLGVVAEVADQVAVMYGGRIVESGSAEDIFYRPGHPYTLGLLNSVPRIDSNSGHRLKAIPGQPPSLINLPSGCSFEPRCDYSKKVEGEKCKSANPDSSEVSTLHLSRCHLTVQDRNNLVRDRS
jgi:peptide/nickel transport system ATP-binding protein